MCGIGGIIYKNPVHSKKTGEVILQMLAGLCRRGPDSAGVALLQPKQEGQLYIDISYEKAGNGEKVIHVLKKYGKILSATDHGKYVRAKMEMIGDRTSMINEINGLEKDVFVASCGQSIEVLKFLGEADQLEKEFNISDYNGRVAVGHTRMATESKVDISHSQPLCTNFRQDLTIIHNGHITNYIKMRASYERKGYSFITGNDSEIIVVYLADKMNNGFTLEEAMKASIQDLDGSFSYVALTPDAVGLAKEPFGMKPMVISETDDCVAFASESFALASGFGNDISMKEPEAGEVIVWNL